MDKFDGTKRENIYIGAPVSVVEKHNQKTDKLTDGYVKNILTSSSVHHRGIKVRIESGEVGRVQIIHDLSNN